MDKLAKVRAEVERLKGWNNNVRNSTRHMTLQEEDFNRGKHSSYLEILNFIDSLQEEPVDKCKNCNNVKGCITCVDGDQWAHYEEPISKELEKASKEWLAPQLDKSYAAYGETKQMELTHFDGYAMLDAIEFGAEWGKNQAMAEIQAQSMALVHGCPEESESEDMEEACEQLAEKARKHKTETSSPFFSQTDYKQGVIDGAKWQKTKDEKILRDFFNARNQGDASFKDLLAFKEGVETGREEMEEQMMSKAIVREVKVDAGGYPYIDATELYDYDKDMPLAKEGDKVKILVIKED